MTRLYNALLAGVVASGILSTILITPATASERTPRKTTTSHAKAVHAAPARTNVRVRSVTRAHFERQNSRGVARFSPAHATRANVVKHVSIPRETATRLESESREGLQMIARSRPVSHVTLHRMSLREITAKHAALRNVTFLTGTVVRADRDFIVLRTGSGREIPIATRVAVINETAFVPGATVVIPALFTNGAFTFVPAFTTADEEQTAAFPAVAPCALNDGDADDAGITGLYAPIGACSFNDGDSDDGFMPPALPVAYAPAVVPQVFTSGYMPVVAAGFVVAQSGPDIVIMTPNFRPLVVNASAAMSTGAMSGPLSAGRYVTVYGYDVGNSLVATSIM